MKWKARCNSKDLEEVVKMADTIPSQPTTHLQKWASSGLYLSSIR
ncbi:unnamed protein product [Gongylonema pulchrum]|uniref:Acetyltransferase n=1 Tax=Gongylonema pulchrum TaxID=637853 RepID=A0A183ES21_9BILA|nr:unnamed protein product [Gongylonema pulchrum]